MLIMPRMLASLQRIDALDPIPNADAIERASVLGWSVVVKKGTFVVGDIAVYLEIDSVPPDIPAFQFLWQKNDEDRPRPANYRLKTIRLRGQLSQGLLVPWSEVFHYIGERMENGETPMMSLGKVGNDLTEALGVTKWEPPLPTGSGEQSGTFPWWISKTDEDRIQARPHLLDALQGRPYRATVKIDGTSATYGLDPTTGEFVVASRNWKIRDGDNHYWAIARLYDIERVLRESYPTVTIQGEIAGPGIQGNRLGLADKQLFVFNAYDYTKDTRVDPTALPFPTAPLAMCGSSFGMSLDEILAAAEGTYAGTTNIREGIVVRSVPYNDLPFVSFKAISNSFLLDGGE